MTFDNPARATVISLQPHLEAYRNESPEPDLLGPNPEESFDTLPPPITATPEDMPPQDDPIFQTTVRAVGALLAGKSRAAQQVAAARASRGEYLTDSSDYERTVIPLSRDT
jgi:hypothetical protein